MLSKKEARTEARARLARLGAEERREASARIAERLWSLEEVAGAKVILLYASLPGEVDTDPIAAAAVERGITLTYPRCLTETRQMVVHRVGGLPDLLAAGPFGIREPDTACPVVDLGEVDVALIPGLGWDRTGVRLGRGQGYYDRMLQSPRWRGFRCGLFFAAQEFDRLPSDRLDVPLEAVVTEREVTRFDGGAAGAG